MRIPANGTGVAIELGDPLVKVSTLGSSRLPVFAPGQSINSRRRRGRLCPMTKQLPSIATTRDDIRFAPKRRRPPRPFAGAGQTPIALAPLLVKIISERMPNGTAGTRGLLELLVGLTLSLVLVARGDSDGGNCALSRGFLAEGGDTKVGCRLVWSARDGLGAGARHPETLRCRMCRSGRCVGTPGSSSARFRGSADLERMASPPPRPCRPLVHSALGVGARSDADDGAERGQGVQRLTTQFCI
jgi:hypothetical protein